MRAAICDEEYYESSMSRINEGISIVHSGESVLWIIHVYSYEAPREITTNANLIITVTSPTCVTAVEAAGELLCETTLSSLDAAIVTRRRRRMTSFAFPSGARQRARLYTSDALCDDGGPAPSTQTAPTAPTARTAAPPRFPPPLPMCAETCNWASDADSDDVGGPGAELGTDCCRQGRQRRLLGSAFIGRSGHCHGYARLAVSVPPRPSALPT
jgi:hypothetical protein